MTLIGRWPDGPCEAVAVNGTYAYTGNGGSLDMLDVSIPENPKRTGSLITPGFVADLAVQGDLVFIANRNRGLRIIDISDPRRPSEVGFLEPGGLAAFAKKMIVQDNQVYLGAAGAGLRITDVSDPTAPVEKGAFKTPGGAREVLVSDSQAYILTWSDGLEVIDVSDRAAPNSVTFFDLNFPVHGYIDSDDGLLYVANQFKGLKIIDISDPASPRQIGFHALPTVELK